MTVQEIYDTHLASLAKELATAARNYLRASETVIDQFQQHRMGTKGQEERELRCSLLRLSEADRAVEFMLEKISA